ncbi:hypothetical protein Nepgr_005050 [Nepenthes gracilis]|uniref:CSC1-like protein RXW8 n=1 Tax=Nepenthes gracilis TaxID=150966 RepID=A0AAD3XG55_NEPGR|nr:hypothetical protein Nepgr_005050 [Nepenthes gracilis]
MQLSALLTSAGINIGLCSLLFSLYSILRKQPSNRNVYFGRTLAQMRSRRHDPHWFDRFVPSPSWIMKAWELPEEEILAIGGLDAVVFVRTLVFSIRIFSIASIVCMCLVLPLNYFGKEMQHKVIPSESLEVFTTQNVKAGSRWLWAHTLALYVISCSACVLLYFENKSIIKMRLAHIGGSSEKPSHFAVLVRGIPWSSEESYSDTLKSFFVKNFPSSYLSHHMVYRCGKIQKLMKTAENMYDKFSNHNAQTGCTPCDFCRQPNAFSILPNKPEVTEGGKIPHNMNDLHAGGKECAAAFVFFKTRYAAASVAQVVQSSNPMLWVTDLAPEPCDVYWSNLCIPYRQFWMRGIANIVATTAFLLFFLFPVALVQGLANLEKLRRMFPFLKGILEKRLVSELVTGYLPPVTLVLFLYMVPPLMMFFSTVEGSISRSGRKKATCCKVLYFTIWNVFFVNLVSGTVITKLDGFPSIKELFNDKLYPGNLPTNLADRAVPALVKFFMTYVLTSGWTSLACELVQLYPLLCNFINKFIFRKDHGPFDASWTFPFHTEVPRVLLFGLIGFAFAILAPLILPLLLVYFSLAFLVYRNQILNVYLFEYDSGGRYWPIIHNTTIFSLLLGQIIAVGLFVLKQSPVCLGFTSVLIGSTVLFNEYCRRRFHPVFRYIAAQVLIEMDQQDDQSRTEEIYQQLYRSYCQLEWITYESSKSRFSGNSDNGGCIRQTEGTEPGKESVPGNPS